MYLQAVGVLVAGHPVERYNGTYYKVDAADAGWPVLKNEHNKYLYRHQPLNAWLLWNELKLDSSICAACIGSADGLLPM